VFFLSTEYTVQPSLARQQANALQPLNTSFFLKVKKKGFQMFLYLVFTVILVTEG